MATPLRVPLGMIHGRFQPFHNGHLEYLRLALERSDVLVVGITNPDPYQIAEEVTSAHRHHAEANPFTFYQRLAMIRDTAHDEGVVPERIVILPFPVNLPERWRYYVPPQAHHFVRVFSAWEQTKVDRIAAAGYAVEILSPGATKEIEATEVRRRLAAGEDWRALIPPAVARIIAFSRDQR